MLFAELMEQILRTFNRSSHELRIEHHVERVYSKVFLWLLPFAVDLDDVAKTLERVKGQANRQDEFQSRDRIIPVDQPGEGIDVSGEKIEIFKNKQDQAS